MSGTILTDVALVCDDTLLDWMARMGFGAAVIGPDLRRVWGETDDSLLTRAEERRWRTRRPESCVDPRNVLAYDVTLPATCPPRTLTMLANVVEARRFAARYEQPIVVFDYDKVVDRSRDTEPMITYACHVLPRDNNNRNNNLCSFVDERATKKWRCRNVELAWKWFVPRDAFVPAKHVFRFNLHLSNPNDAAFWRNMLVQALLYKGTERPQLVVVANADTNEQQFLRFKRFMAFASRFGAAMSETRVDFYWTISPENEYATLAVTLWDEYLLGVTSGAWNAACYVGNVAARKFLETDLISCSQPASRTGGDEEARSNSCGSNVLGLVYGGALINVPPYLTTLVVRDEGATWTVLRRGKNNPPVFE